MNRMKKDPPTAERVRELFDYDPDTGELRWRVDRLPYPAGTKVGCADQRGRLVVSVDRRRLYVSRVIWLHVTGKWPQGAIWFRNGNRTDLRWSNLEERSQHAVQ